MGRASTNLYSLSTDFKANFVILLQVHLRILDGYLSLLSQYVDFVECIELTWQGIRCQHAQSEMLLIL